MRFPGRIAGSAGPLLLVLLVAAVIYSNTFSSPFVFDDLPFIAHNHYIKDATDLSSIWKATRIPSRFVAYLSFALDWHWGKGEVTPFHVTNLIIHVMNGWLVFWLVQLLLNSPTVGAGFKPAPTKNGYFNNKKMIALAAALLFVAHPVQTESVTYITQRFASLVTLFYVLSVCLFVFARQTRQRAAYAGCVIAGVLAMFTKQIAVTLPFMIILVDAVFFKREKGRLPVYWFVIAAFFLVIPALYSFKFMAILTRGATSGSLLGEPITPWTYFLTQARVIVTYFKLLFFPVGQNLLYEFPASQHFLEPTTLFSFAGLGLIAAFSVFAFRRSPLVGFGLWWFFLALSVESSFLVIRHVIFEHRLYLPSVGFFIALSMFLWQVCRNRAAFLVVVAAAVAVCGFLTYRRNVVWQTPVALWEDVVAKSPRLLKPKLNLAVAYADAGRFMDAIKVYDRMIEEAPSAEALGNRANVYFKMKAYDVAIADYAKALAILPDSARILTGRGDAYFKKGDVRAAIADYTAAIAANPQYYMAYNNRANAYRVLQKYALAQMDYNQALAHNRHLIDAYIGIGALAYMQGDHEKALDYFSHAVSLDGKNTDALMNRASTHSVMRNFGLAQEDFEKALVLDPQNGQIYYNRGVLFTKMGETQRANEDLERAKALGYTP